jgi:hypothetical protein
LDAQFWAGLSLRPGVAFSLRRFLLAKQKKAAQRKGESFKVRNLAVNYSYNYKLT